MTASTSSSDRWFPLIPIGLGAVLVLMGSIFGVVGWLLFVKQQARSAWPSTDGTISSCTWASTTSRKSVSLPDDYWTVTAFRYTVDGQGYEQQSTLLAGSGEPEGPLPYSKGQRVKVYFDPLVPSAGALTTDRGGPEIAFMLGAVLCAVLCLPFFFFGARLFARRRAASA